MLIIGSNLRGLSPWEARMLTLIFSTLIQKIKVSVEYTNQLLIIFLDFSLHHPFRKLQTPFTHYKYRISPTPRGWGHWEMWEWVRGHLLYHCINGFPTPRDYIGHIRPKKSVHPQKGGGGSKKFWSPKYLICSALCAQIILECVMFYMQKCIFKAFKIC